LTMSRFRSDAGAAAVEFAFVLVPLLLILMGVIDFGQIYNEKLALTAAAREGARVMAIPKSDGSAATSAAGTARVITVAAQQGVTLTPAQISIPTTCPSVQSPPPTVTVTITYPLSSVTGMFDTLLQGNRTVSGVMQCGG
jgi:Flp pilus assembly protein TadG